MQDGNFVYNFYIVEVAGVVKISSSNECGPDSRQNQKPSAVRSADLGSCEGTGSAACLAAWTAQVTGQCQTVGATLTNASI